MHPGMCVRWNRARTGRIVLVSEDGWIVVHENACAGMLVFLRVDGDVQIRRDQRCAEERNSHKKGGESNE